MVTSADDAVADRLRPTRNQGMRERYVYEVAGHNWRMTDLQAALALPQLEHVRPRRGRTARDAAAVGSGLADVAAVITPHELPGRRTRVAPVHPVAASRCRRHPRWVLASLTADGVGSGIYYPKVIGDYDCCNHPRVVRADTQVARRCASAVFSLPVHPYLAEADVDRIVAAVRRAVHA